MSESREVEGADGRWGRRVRREATLTVAVLGVCVGGLVAQEPAPIPAGVAPPPGIYAPGIDVQHYDDNPATSPNCARSAWIPPLPASCGILSRCI